VPLILDGARHFRRRLARANDDDATAKALRQMRRYAARRTGSVHRRAKHRK
jgi:hypothetical protein